MEFLRDANVTNTAGQNAYDRWVARGKSAPVAMDMLTLSLGATGAGDANHDGDVDVDDMLLVIQGWGTCAPPGFCKMGDVTGDNRVNIDDLLLVIINWG
jgi:hypothetical protein